MNDIIDEYKDIQNDVLNICNMSITILLGYEKILYHILQCQLKEKVEKNRLVNTRVFKTTNGNTTKWLKIKKYVGSYLNKQKCEKNY